MATPNSNYAFKCPPTLPLDVLFEIFKAYIEDYYHTRPFSHMREPKEIPWFLGHICRQWRMAAITTPQLWKRLPPLKLTTQRDTRDKHMAMFEELLKRSGAHPLRVQFEFTCKAGHAKMEAGLLKPLLATSTRWEEVTVRCLFARTVGSLFRAIEGRIPHLRRVELLLVDEDGEIGEKAPEKLVKLFCNTPMLSELFLQILPSSSPILAVPWEQLTKLQWGDYGGEGIYEVLKYAKNLDILMAMDCSYRGESGQPDLEHSKLRKFYIHIKGCESCLSLLELLKLPALEVLVITRDFDPERVYWYLPLDVLKSFMIRSQCDLRHLVLHGPELEDIQILEILEAAPNLESLEIDPGVTTFGELLSWLVFEEAEETLLPYLRCLKLVFPLVITFEQTEMIQRIVESRDQVSVGGEDSTGRLFSPLHNVCIGFEGNRFEVRSNLDSGEVVSSSQPFTRSTFRDLVPMLNQDFDRTVMGLNERWIADVFRWFCLDEDTDRSLRKACEPLISEDFIKSVKWMLVGHGDIVYIHPEHELRKSASRWDIAFGIYGGGPELLKEYCDFEIFAESRRWWKSFPYRPRQFF